MIITPSLASLCFFTITKWYNYYPTDCDYSATPRPHFGMSLVVRGSAEIEVDGHTDKVLPGEILFVPAGSQYISRWSGDSLNYTILFSFFPHTQFPGDKILQVQKVSPKYEDEFQKLFLGAYRDFEPAGEYHFASLSYFFEIMARILPRLSYTEKPKCDERIARAARHIEEHYSDNSTTAELAAVAHMSVSRFHVAFKAQMGVTPIDYRNSMRIRYAIMNLIQGNKTIEAISQELGFESVTYFRRVFKKEFGCSPSGYLELHKSI